MPGNDDIVVCSRCQCDEVRISHRRWYEYALSLFNYLPFRCMGCHSRFYRRMSEAR